MNYETAKFSNECPREEIAVYLDGELAPREEFDLEMHFAVCEACNAELKRQKKLLRALDFALEAEKDFELPDDFTKTVVVNAESKVRGLRHPSERSNALFICSGLFFFVLLGIGFGSGTDTVFGAFGKFVEQFLAVGGFVAHLAYDIALGFVVIVRSLCLQFVYKSAFASVFILAVCGLCVIAFFRLMLRYNRI